MQAKADAGLAEMLPDELQHQQLVEVRVQQRPHNGVKIPVVVVRPLREVDDHASVSVPSPGCRAAFKAAKLHNAEGYSRS